MKLALASCRRSRHTADYVAPASWQEITPSPPAACDVTSRDAMTPLAPELDDLFEAAPSSDTLVMDL